LVFPQTNPKSDKLPTEQEELKLLQDAKTVVTNQAFQMKRALVKMQCFDR
jgi:hypothetical protein